MMPNQHHFDAIASYYKKFDLKINSSVNLDNFGGGIFVFDAENLGKTQTLARMIGVDIIPSALGFSGLPDS